MLSQFIRFAGVGILGTIAHYTTLLALVQTMNVNAVISSCIGFVAGALVNYHLNYRYTFRSAKRHSEAMVKFFTIALIGLLINAFIMYCSVEILRFQYLLSQMAATAVVLFWNFTGNRSWTFRERYHSPQ